MSSIAYQRASPKPSKQESGTSSKSSQSKSDNYILSVVIPNVLSLFLIAVTIIALPQIYNAIIYVNSLLKINLLFDIASIMLITPGFFYLQHYIEPLFSQLSRKIIGNKITSGTIDDKVARFNNLFYLQLILTSLQVVGGYLIYDTELMPKLLGGTFNYNEQLAKWPVEIPFYLRVYMLVVISFNLQAPIREITTRKGRFDYHVLNLHHLIAIIMLLTYFFIRQSNIAIPLLASHYLANVFNPISLILKGVQFSHILTFITVFMFLATFLYGRGITYFYEIISHACLTLIYPPESMENYQLVNCLLVFCILCLFYADLYWIRALAMVSYDSVKEILTKQRKFELNGID